MPYNHIIVVISVCLKSFASQGGGAKINYMKYIDYYWEPGFYSKSYKAPDDGLFAVYLITLVESQVKVYINGNLVAVSQTGDGGHTFHGCIERIFVSKGDEISFSLTGSMNSYNYVIHQIGSNTAMRFYYAK